MLVLDAGTTGIKAFVFDGGCRVLAKAYKKISKARLRLGWVEQDPREMVRVSKRVMREAVKQSGKSLEEIRGFGITNQREATVLWNRKTGKSVYPIIGWEDARTKLYCHEIEKKVGERVRELTGLRVDSYFSASKIRWILDNVPDARRLLEDSRLAFGTIDSWLIWNLCAGHPHVTDETNASRTLLYNIQERKWSDLLTDTFGVPQSVLPDVYPSRANFGVLAKDIVGTEVPVLAVCGDQQSSLYAASMARGIGKNATKITYGTGSFVMQDVGKKFKSRKQFFTTLTPGARGTNYALETKVEGTGESVASVLDDPNALRKFLKSLARKVDTQIRKLPIKPKMIVADGGAARDGIVVEMQSDISGVPVCLQQTFDGTALGTALLVWDQIEK